MGVLDTYDFDADNEGFTLQADWTRNTGAGRTGNGCLEILDDGSFGNAFRSITIDGAEINPVVKGYVWNNSSWNLVIRIDGTEQVSINNNSGTWEPFTVNLTAGISQTLSFTDESPSQLSGFGNEIRIDDLTVESDGTTQEVTLDTAVEVEAVLGVGLKLELPYAVEREQAFDLSAALQVTLDTAVETETAQDVASKFSVVLDTAVESESALEIAADYVQTVVLDTAHEQERIHAISADQHALLDTARERETPKSLVNTNGSLIIPIYNTAG